MNPATITQQAMTEEGKKAMFAQWEQQAPQNPKMGWHSSLYTEFNNAGVYCIKAMIEEYDEDGLIETIGLATLEIETGVYTEIYD